MILNRKVIQKSCQEHEGCYRTPSVNDKLYLHHLGIMEIDDALLDYTNIVALWLNNNALARIEGINHMKKLKSLFLQCNGITKIEGLSGLEALDNVNLSENFIRRIEGLEENHKLTSLNLRKNQIESLEDVEQLSKLKNLVVLDLSQNKISDPEIIETVILKMKNLKLLKLDGNPIVRNVKDYRKLLIQNLPNLNYLDDKPVFDEERRLVSVFWRAGAGKEGFQAQKEERNVIREEERQKNINRIKNMNAMLDRYRAEKAKNEDESALLNSQRITDEALENALSEEENPLQNPETPTTHEGGYSQVDYWTISEASAFDIKISFDDI